MNSVRSNPRKRKHSPLTVVLILSLVLGGAVFILNRVTTAFANLGDISLAESTYPNIVGSRIDNCSLCHTSSIPNLNPYGAAYMNLGRGNASSLHMIENLDSDGDGFTNIVEINALTYPGNASDFPQPPTPTSAPTATATHVPPTATATQVTQPTNTPTSQAYPPPATATSAPTQTPTVAATATQQPTLGATATQQPTVGATATQAPTEIVITATAIGGQEKEKPSKTPRVKPTRRPTKTPRATRTPRATPTLICIPDDDSSDSARDTYQSQGIQPNDPGSYDCPPGYSPPGVDDDYNDNDVKDGFLFHMQNLYNQSQRARNSRNP